MECALKHFEKDSYDNDSLDDDIDEESLEEQNLVNHIITKMKGVNK